MNPEGPAPRPVTPGPVTGQSELSRSVLAAHTSAQARAAVNSRPSFLIAVELGAHVLAWGLVQPPFLGVSSDFSPRTVEGHRGSHHPGVSSLTPGSLPEGPQASHRVFHA